MDERTYTYNGYEIKVRYLASAGCWVYLASNGTESLYGSGYQSEAEAIQAANKAIKESE